MLRLLPWMGIEQLTQWQRPPMANSWASGVKLIAGSCFGQFTFLL
jgi:hypothetical protein